MSFSTLTVDLVFYGLRESVTMSLMKIGERSFEILYISIANVLIIFGRKCVLVSKGAYAPVKLFCPHPPPGDITFFIVAPGFLSP